MSANLYPQLIPPLLIPGDHRIGEFETVFQKHRIWTSFLNFKISNFRRMLQGLKRFEIQNTWKKRNIGSSRNEFRTFSEALLFNWNNLAPISPSIFTVFTAVEVTVNLHWKVIAGSDSPSISYRWLPARVIGYSPTDILGWWFEIVEFTDKYSSDTRRRQLDTTKVAVHKEQKTSAKDIEKRHWRYRW